jgi:hypothetical protein
LSESVESLFGFRRGQLAFVADKNFQEAVRFEVDIVMPLSAGEYLIALLTTFWTA